jgi:hypothetical protein
MMERSSRAPRKLRLPRHGAALVALALMLAFPAASRADEKTLEKGIREYESILVSRGFRKWAGEAATRLVKSWETPKAEIQSPEDELAKRWFAKKFGFRNGGFFSVRKDSSCPKSAGQGDCRFVPVLSLEVVDGQGVPLNYFFEFERRSDRFSVSRVFKSRLANADALLLGKHPNELGALHGRYIFSAGSKVTPSAPAPGKTSVPAAVSPAAGVALPLNSARAD